MGITTFFDLDFIAIISKNTKRVPKKGMVLHIIPDCLDDNSSPVNCAITNIPNAPSKFAMDYGYFDSVIYTA